jgi:hypothetical protein
MTQRSLLATTLLIVCMCGGGPLQQTSFAQKASVPKQPDKAAIATKRERTARFDGHGKERQNFQAGVDEIHGG